MQTIPGSRYACAEFLRHAKDATDAWTSLCGDWLADSGYPFDDRPLFEPYPTRFHGPLCIPVRPL